MKPGDLLRDKEYGDIGILIKIGHPDNDTIFDDHEKRTYNYLVLDTRGKCTWLPLDYLEKDCEIIYEST